jgi:hypothetical protein
MSALKGIDRNPVSCTADHDHRAYEIQQHRGLAAIEAAVAQGALLAEGLGDRHPVAHGALDQRGLAAAHQLDHISFAQGFGFFGVHRPEAPAMDQDHHLGTVALKVVAPFDRLLVGADPDHDGAAGQLGGRLGGRLRLAGAEATGDQHDLDPRHRGQEPGLGLGAGPTLEPPQPPLLPD